MKKYIAIDIGGTGLKHGLVDEQGNIIEKTEIPSEAHKGGPHLVDLVRQICQEYVANHSITAIGISTAGMVDPVEGKIIYSGKQIPDYIGTQWKKKSLKKNFRSAAKSRMMSTALDIPRHCAVLDRMRAAVLASQSARESVRASLWMAKFSTARQARHLKSAI